MRKGPSGFITRAAVWKNRPVITEKELGLRETDTGQHLDGF